MDPERPTDDAPATLQSRLEEADDDRCDLDAAARIGDPVALLNHLDVSGHFHRDSRLGRVFHRGMVSLRETEPTDSLHVSVHGNRLLAHIDGVSPLAVRADGSSAYSLRRALTHNLAGMAQDFLWLLRGRQGDHRSELSCEWVAPEAARAARDLHLLDPATGAWSVQMDARVAGSLDEERLRAALRSVLGLAVADPDPLTLADCADDGALSRARDDLSRAPARADAHPPLRACLARHGDGDVLMLSLNHAASDGFGALQVMQAIARAYAGVDSTPRLDFLAMRELPVRPAPGFEAAPARAYRRAVERLRNLRERPAPLAEDEPGDDVGCGYHLVSLTAAETLGTVGDERGRADTDVLMAALHLAIDDWNDQHAVGGRSIAALVQADLRPPQWREDPIANFSVVARVSTTPGDRSSPASTLETISAELARNERMRTGVALIAALERARLLGLWAKQSVIVLAPLTGNLIDTTVLCNLGWLDEAPSFGPEAGEATELWFSTPARAPMSLCLGAVTAGGRLHLSFRYPHRLLGPGAARRFAECYVEHLRQVGEARSRR